MQRATEEMAAKSKILLSFMSSSRSLAVWMMLARAMEGGMA